MEYLIGIKKEITSPHKHKNYEILVYTRGRGILRTNKTDIKTAPGRIIIVPPGTVHSSLAMDKNFELIYINGEFNHFFNLTSPVVVADSSDREGLELAKMIYNNRFSNHEYLVALISAFSHFLLNCINMENEVFLAIKNIMDEITDNFHNYDIEPSSVLKKSGYSEDYIRAQFKKITKKTPTEFLTEIRISHACYLIEAYRNTIPLTDISEQCGYIDYVYFSRRFKQIKGMSPRKYMEDVMGFNK